MARTQCTCGLTAMLAWTMHKVRAEFNMAAAWRALVREEHPLTPACIPMRISPMHCHPCVFTLCIFPHAGLMIALSMPNVHIVGISCVHGNVVSGAVQVNRFRAIRNT